MCVDEGKIKKQEKVDVREDKRNEEIQKLILEREWEIYTKTIKETLEERIKWIEL